MNDELRKYIQDRKEEWQDPAPPSGLWDKIDASTRPKVVSIKRARLWAVSGAASAAAVIIAAFFIMQKPAPIAGDPFQEVEQFYEAQLTSKMEQLQAFDVDQELLDEVGVLQEEYGELKAEMEVSVNNELILEQMMENYRWRLKILEHLLMELEEDADEPNTPEDNVEI